MAIKLEAGLNRADDRTVLCGRCGSELAKILDTRGIEAHMRSEMGERIVDLRNPPPPLDVEL